MTTPLTPPIPPAVTATAPPVANAPTGPCPCNSFYCFLQAWASAGGNIVLLTFLAVFFIAATVYMMHEWGPASPAVMFVVPIAGGFAGAITMRMGITKTGAADSTPDQH